MGGTQEVTAEAARTPRALVWGDVIDDIVVRPAGPIRPDTDTDAVITMRPGGSAANVAAWLGALGVRVDFVGRVGSGDVDRHSALLAERGVTPHLIADPDRPTGTIVILLDEENRRTMLTQRGANVAMTPDDIPDSLLETADIAHFTGYSVFSAESEPDAEASFRRFVDRARTHAVPLSVDPGSAGYLRDYGPERFLRVVAGCTIMVPNYDEGVALTGLDDPIAIAAALGERFPVVVLTVGERGTVVQAQGSAPVLLAVRAVPKADTTGAGDAFSAGFIRSWLETGDAVGSARRASTLAGRSLALVGGRPGDKVAE